MLETGTPGGAELDGRSDRAAEVTWGIHLAVEEEKDDEANQLYGRSRKTTCRFTR